MSSHDISTINPKSNSPVLSFAVCVQKIDRYMQNKITKCLMKKYLSLLLVFTTTVLHYFTVTPWLSLWQPSAEEPSPLLPSPAENLSFSATSLWLQLCPVMSDHIQPLAPGFLSHQALLHAKARLQD